MVMFVINLGISTITLLLTLFGINAARRSAKSAEQTVELGKVSGERAALYSKRLDATLRFLHGAYLVLNAIMKQGHEALGVNESRDTNKSRLGLRENGKRVLNENIGNIPVIPEKMLNLFANLLQRLGGEEDRWSEIIDCSMRCWRQLGDAAQQELGLDALGTETLKYMTK